MAIAVRGFFVSICYILHFSWCNNMLYLLILSSVNVTFIATLIFLARSLHNEDSND